MDARAWSEIASNYGTLVLAAFAGIVGIREYRKSLQLKLIDSLMTLEDLFQRSLPMLDRIADDVEYRSNVEPALKESLDERLSESEQQHRETIKEVDLGLRFFVLLKGISRNLGSEGRELEDAYAYHVNKLFGREDRATLNRYVERYYPCLRPWQGQQQRSS